MTLGVIFVSVLPLLALSLDVFVFEAFTTPFRWMGALEAFTYLHTVERLQKKVQQNNTHRATETTKEKTVAQIRK